jgi:hypothetical protein
MNCTVFIFVCLGHRGCAASAEETNGVFNTWIPFGWYYHKAKVEENSGILALCSKLSSDLEPLITPVALSIFFTP